MALIPCTHLNHVNFLVENFAADLETFKRLLGADYVLDIPREYWLSGLFTVSDAILELYSPRGSFFLAARYGPHYVGAEYVVKDVAEAREILTERGIRIVRDLDVAVHTHPADTFGIAMELYGKDFHQSNPEWFRPAQYWAEHPLGLTGIKRLVAVVNDLDAALALYTELFGGVAQYETTRAAGTARAIGLAFGDGILEFMTPTAPGPVADHLRRYGDGLRSTVFGVADTDRARAYFAGLGVGVQDGDDDGGIQIDPSQSAGILFEFSESGNA